MLVIYIQLLRWNRKWGSRKQLRVRANIHTLTATREKSRKSVSLERSAVPIYAAFEPCFHTNPNPSYETSPALFWSGTLCLVIPVVRCISMCRFSCEILLFINILFSDNMIFYIFIVLPQTFLSYMMDLSPFSTKDDNLQCPTECFTYFICLSGKWDCSHHCRVSYITAVFCSSFCHDSLVWW